jgi:DNA-binding transcriptional ArsR family regulator
MLDPAVMAALASPKRPHVLEWLRYPQMPFAPVCDGAMVDDGACVLFIATKLGVAQPTATAHMQALARPGLVSSKRISQWTFYKCDEAALAALKRKIAEEL